MREISVQNTIRMWDTYLVSFLVAASLYSSSHSLLQAEGPDAFSQFHLYVCSAFLVKWSDKLRQMDFQVDSLVLVYGRDKLKSSRWFVFVQGIIMFLQSLPTQDWGDHEIEMLLSEAFVLNSIWHNAQSHFNGK
jgi:hypothetical protein